jgi:predicted nucleotide-binding protein
MKKDLSPMFSLHQGDVELPSDIQGIVYIPFKDSVEEIRLRIMKELKEAHYEIKF